MAIVSKDSLRSSVEAATGGLCTVLYDCLGHPNIMRRIPKFRIEDVYPDLGVTGAHPAFIVNGVEKSELFVSVYINAVADNVGVSLPGLAPAMNMNFNEAAACCASKGPGWHLMSNAEWGALQALALRSGFQPHGNTAWGLYHALKYESGTLEPGSGLLGTGEDGKTCRTLGGTGPLSWRHDNSPAGIADLVGNAWEWTAGMRLCSGEIQIIPDNDVAGGASMANDSPDWKAILQNGSLAAPGSPDTLKYNCINPSASGTLVLDKEAPSERGTIDHCAFKSLTAKSGVSVPALLKVLGLFPADASAPVGEIWSRIRPEAIPIRGGDFSYGAFCGLFSLFINYPRNLIAGFRSAFIL